MKDNYNDRAFIRLNPENKKWMQQVQKQALVPMSLAKLANYAIKQGRHQTELDLIPMAK